MNHHQPVGWSRLTTQHTLRVSVIGSAMDGIVFDPVWIISSVWFIQFVIRKGRISFRHLKQMPDNGNFFFSCSHFIKGFCFFVPLLHCCFKAFTSNGSMGWFCGIFL